VTSEAATIISGVLSGVFGGGLAVVGAVLAVRWGVRDLEETEIRRQKVNCITSLYGLRFVLGEIAEGSFVRIEDLDQFMFEINRAGALFAEQTGILNDLRDFHDVLKTRKVDPTDRLVALLRKMGAQTKLRMDYLSDADVKNVFRLNLPVPPAHVSAQK
jgi:hypothetical protein